MTLTKTEILKTFTVDCETGSINVLKHQRIVDENGVDQAPRTNWRRAIEPGDTATVDSLLGEYAQSAKDIAGQKFGGWRVLEQQRQRAIQDAISSGK